MPRVTATPAARAFLAELAAGAGPLIFHQSGGCCDGSSPMLFPAAEFLTSAGDIRLGEIDGVPVFISASQFGAWAHTQLVLDVVPGQGGMFSLDNGTGRRFLSRARVFADDELSRLAPVATGAD